VQLYKITIRKPAKLLLADVSNELSQKILELSDLSFSYDNHVIFDAINLELWSNDKICIVGSNGVDKTTLLNLIAKKINMITPIEYLSRNIECNVATTELNENIIQSEYNHLNSSEFLCRNYLGCLELNNSSYKTKITMLSKSGKARLVVS
jgi:ATPase subunit of ABC transporter with duplicated ATPase domains